MFDFSDLQMFGYITGATKQPVPKKVKEKVKEDYGDYLCRGEKILSLLRERKEREFVPSDMLEAINIATYQKKRNNANAAFWYLMQRVGNLVCGCISDRDAFLELFAPFENSIGITEPTEEEKDLLNATLEKEHRLPRSQAGSLESKKISLPFGNRERDIRGTVDYSGILVPEKAKMRTRYNGQMISLRGERNFRHVGTPMIFSLIVFLIRMREEVQKRIADGEDSILYNLLREQQTRRLETAAERGEILIYEDVLCCQFIREYLEEEHISYRIVTKHEYREGTTRVGVLEESDFIPVFLLAESVDLGEMFFSFQKFWRGIPCVLVPGTFWSTERTKEILSVFDVIADVYVKERKEEEFRKTLSSEFAKVWQTKKNIPQKMIARMENSSFNQWFGYIEFDEECDVEKLSEIEKEFDALSDLLHLAEHKEVSLRFRKLGKHKASGLYFPYLKCLCVDVRKPSSMAHECFHMLDFENGRLSGKYSFYRICELYEGLLRKAMDSLNRDDALYVRLAGKSKYNLDYYLEPTEIFARCGELYLTEVLKVDNSLVKPEGGFAYPKDEGLMGLVKNYFDNFFERGQCHE